MPPQSANERWPLGRDPLVNAIDSAGYKPIQVPVGDNITADDKALAARLHSARTIIWGGLIVTGPYSKTGKITMRGTWDSEGKLDATSDGIHVGIFARPETTWANVTTGIVLGFPRGKDSAAYLMDSGVQSTLARVEFILSNGMYSVQAVRRVNKEDAFLVIIKPGSYLVRGHPWPFQAKNDSAADKWELELPQRAMEVLVAGMRTAAIYPDKDRIRELGFPRRVWDLDAFLKKFGAPVQSKHRPPLLQFADIKEYVTVTMAAVIMEGLFIEKAAMQLRSMPFRARFYRLTPESTECIVIVDLDGRSLAKHFGGALDSYLEPGQEILLAFRKGPSTTMSAHERKMDDLIGHVNAEVALPPKSERDSDKSELWLQCAVSQLYPRHITEGDIITGSHTPGATHTDSSTAPRAVWLKIGDTTKAMRRAFNGVARILPGDGANETRNGYDSECDLSMPLTPPSSTTNGHILLDVLCGNAVPHYFDYDLVAGVPEEHGRRMANLFPPGLRAPAHEILSSIPCGISLITGAPGCGKSMKLALVAGLCILQDFPVLLTATQHKAIDACMDKIVSVLCAGGRVDIVILRVYGKNEDLQACQRVVRNQDWKTGAYRSHSKWTPAFSLAAWLAFLVKGEPNPLTWESATTTHPLCNAPCVLALQDAMERCDNIMGMSASELSTQQTRRTKYVKETIALLLSNASLVAATPHAALDAQLKDTTQRVKALIVDEAATMPEALLLQLVFQQKVFAFAFDKKQLPAHSDSKSTIGERRVNPLEDQYILSTADRLMMLSWPVDQQRQQIRMLPGLMDPARATFYPHDGIEDIEPPNRDHSIGKKVEAWYHSRAQQRGPRSRFSSPPSGKYWPAFLNVEGTECVVNKNTNSSSNQSMWDQVWPMLRTAFFDPNSRFAIPPEKICFLVPYRAQAVLISESLMDSGFHVRVQLGEKSEVPSAVRAPRVNEIPDYPQGGEDDPAEPITNENVKGARVPYHRPGGPCVSTIDAFQGQDAELVVFITTVNSETGPKFLRNKNRLCVAMTRMRQALLVVGDQGAKDFKPPSGKKNRQGDEVDGAGQRANTKEFKAIWGWFAVNKRVI
ncbi:hypothetical protein N0V82_007752 [Gnomoniopsis sp. IMI 355080]|nr:hypothetical protein N0V82_007752 [Gnomoniopsis sp. IMI 355080]